MRSNPEMDTIVNVKSRSAKVSSPKFYLSILFGLLFFLPVKSQNDLLRVEFSEAAGYYQNSFYLKLYSPDTDAVIRYTTDGSEPGRKSTRFRKSIRIRKTTVVRARAYDGSQKGEVNTSTFIIGQQTSFPVVSIAVDPDLLFNEEKGLFKTGNSADTLFPFYGSNFWSRKEVAIHTELFETDGTRVLSIPTGMRIFGGLSRLFPQKSMAIVARDKYGPKRIEYPVFPYLDQKKFKYWVLRNSGSDFGKSHLKDAYITYLLRDFDVETQAFRPAHTFINGKYWGIYNIREKVNRFFIASHSEYHKDSVELIEHRFKVNRGNGRHYREMLRFLEKNDISEPHNYERLQTMMEVESFIDHQIAEIYIDNKDAGGNIKFWRPNKPDGRWRWILYDTDWGMGLHDRKSYRNNTLVLHTDEEGDKWPNPPWSTFLLRTLLENEDFETTFVNRFCDHMNASFEPEHALSVLDTMVRMYDPEIRKHIKRWELSNSARNAHLSRMRTFVRKRPSYMRNFLRKKFDLGNDAKLEVVKNGGGEIMLNDNLNLKKTHFSGWYFENRPVKLRAKAYYGFKFSHWEFENGDTEHSHEIEIPVDTSGTLVMAVFEASVNPLAGKIIFNEVSVNNKASGDWVEVFNTSKEYVSLSDWYFLDAKHEWRLPPYRIGPKGFVVLCQDTSAFRKAFPGSQPLVGNFPFGLSRIKEKLQLFTDIGAPIDSFSYLNNDFDTTFTLNLLLPTLDNSDSDNWEILKGPGTPHAENPFFVASKARKLKSTLFTILGGLGLIFLMLVVNFSYKHYLRS
ncbi:MAG: CotH kinase family protein [Bacteroidota bacterium]